MKKITEKTILADILEDRKMAEILAKYNLPCLSCPFAKYEVEQLKIGDVFKQYGIKSEKLLEELNSVYKKKK